MTELILNGEKGSAAVLFAHGAGAGHDSDFMTGMAEILASNGLIVARFDFDYMVRAMVEGRRRPPDRQPKLLASMTEALLALKSQVGSETPLFLAGKSMGGRMASLMLAEQPNAASGAIVFGYPFHPPGKPDKLRTDHLPGLERSLLVCQGERDPFGKREEFENVNLGANVTIQWLPDGDHDLKPRKKSGLTHMENMEKAAETAAAFIQKAIS